MHYQDLPEFQVNEAGKRRLRQFIREQKINVLPKLKVFKQRCTALHENEGCYAQSDNGRVVHKPKQSQEEFLCIVLDLATAIPVQSIWDQLTFYVVEKYGRGKTDKEYCDIAWSLVVGRLMERLAEFGILEFDFESNSYHVAPKYAP